MASTSLIGWLVGRLSPACSKASTVSFRGLESNAGRQGGGSVINERALGGNSDRRSRSTGLRVVKGHRVRSAMNVRTDEGCRAKYWLG